MASIRVNMRERDEKAGDLKREAVTLFLLEIDKKAASRYLFTIIKQYDIKFLSEVRPWTGNWKRADYTRMTTT